MSLCCSFSLFSVIATTFATAGFVVCFPHFLLLFLLLLSAFSSLVPLCGSLLPLASLETVLSFVSSFRFPPPLLPLVCFARPAEQLAFPCYGLVQVQLLFFIAWGMLFFVFLVCACQNFPFFSSCSDLSVSLTFLLFCSSANLVTFWTVGFSGA